MNLNLRSVVNTTKLMKSVKKYSLPVLAVATTLDVAFTILDYAIIMKQRREKRLKRNFNKTVQVRRRTRSLLRRKKHRV